MIRSVSYTLPSFGEHVFAGAAVLGNENFLRPPEGLYVLRGPIERLRRRSEQLCEGPKSRKRRGPVDRSGAVYADLKPRPSHRKLLIVIASFIAQHKSGIDSKSPSVLDGTTAVLRKPTFEVKCNGSVRWAVSGLVETGSTDRAVASSACRDGLQEVGAVHCQGDLHTASGLR